MTHAWGSTDTDDRDYFDPDPHRHCTGPCIHQAEARAQASWERTLAAVDADAGLSVYRRADLDDLAWWDDWEEERRG